MFRSMILTSIFIKPQVLSIQLWWMNIWFYKKWFQSGKINIIITKDGYVLLKKTILCHFFILKKKKHWNIPLSIPVQLWVYPNPTANLVNIELKGAKSSYKVKVYNLKGELVKEDMVEPDSKLRWNTLDKNGKQVAQGIYLIQTEVAGKKLAQKICVIKWNVKIIDLSGWIKGGMVLICIPWFLFPCLPFWSASFHSFFDFIR